MLGLLLPSPGGQSQLSRVKEGWLGSQRLTREVMTILSVTAAFRPKLVFFSFCLFP